MAKIPIVSCPNCKGKEATKDHCPPHLGGAPRCHWRRCGCGWTYDTKSGEAFQTHRYVPVEDPKDKK